MPSDHLNFSSLIADFDGEILTKKFDLGRYATDASIYQIMPQGVVVPKSVSDVKKTITFAADQGASILPRGGGTSQCGQTVGNNIVIDYSKHLNRLVHLDVENRICVVEPGIVLDQLNQLLKPHGLWFPVDVSTASRATIGGMAANNSCGSRSIRYGLMRDNVLAVDALMANGEQRRFDRIAAAADADALTKSLLALGQREQQEIANRFPDVMRRVGGYNIDALVPDQSSNSSEFNLAHLMVGSEGTLGCSEEITLKLSPLPKHKLLGVCHFPTFYAAMDAAQHIVKLDPVAVELIDRTMIELSMDIEVFQSVVKQFVRGEPEAILLVEFAEDDPAENRRRLTELGNTMADLGFQWHHPEDKRGGVVEAIDPAFQSAIFEVRKSGLNIMMSMKEARKPISFVEDCAVPLKDLAQYTARLTEIFHQHGTKGTWYAHASVGCLHVRPVLNLRLDEDVTTMRAIAEAAFDMVIEYKGSHSGEHGDGLVRSEFHQKMFGERMVNNFAEIKQLFDPDGVFNPGKIVDPPAMDQRSLFRYAPDYQVKPMQTTLDWSQWPGAGDGFQGAVEMCNNNGACRKLTGGGMCPSYRVTRNEKDVTRGRANSLRLAISGQLGEGALASAEMQETMSLCVGCKACKRECPTGVDMAKMKIEVSAAVYKAHGLDLHHKLVANLPAYAPFLARISWLSNIRNHLPLLKKAMESMAGFSQYRQLPLWRRDYYRDESGGPEAGPEVVLFGDTFNRYFEPENLTAAKAVLTAAGYRVVVPEGIKKPLCCGRTWLTNGMVDRAKQEMQRLIDALYPFAARGVPIIGLEPSCTLGLIDELPSLLNVEQARMVASQVRLFETFIAEHPLDLVQEAKLKPIARNVLLHGHCHQKAFDQMGDVEKVLGLIPDLQVRNIESACCGMAGAFGYGRDTYSISKAMANVSLLPAIDQADAETIIVADGTSCRQQIESGSNRSAIHVARLLQQAL